MFNAHARFVRIPRVLIAIAMLVGSALAAGGGLVRAQQDDAPNTDATSILELVWPAGVDLLAGRELELEDGQYEWRVTTLTAEEEADDPIETGRGVLVAVGGPVHVLMDGSSLVRLASGAAMPIDEGHEVVVVSVGSESVDYMLIELITSEDAEQVVTGDTVELVGPVRVPVDDEYALVLLNLPVAVTIDVTPDEVIDGAIRPAVSVAHVGNVIPEDLTETRNYDRWIIALYPLAGPTPGATPTPVTRAPSPTTAPVMPTSVPVQPTQPSTPSATSTPTAENTPTSEPTETPAPTNTPVPTNTAAPTQTPTNTPVPTQVSPTNTPPPTQAPPPTNTPVPTATDSPGS